MITEMPLLFGQARRTAGILMDILTLVTLKTVVQHWAVVVSMARLLTRAVVNAKYFMMKTVKVGG